MNIIEMIEEFQCPGCAQGPTPSNCPAFKETSVNGGSYCEGHCAGTQTLFGGGFFLGLPRGFNKSVNDPVIVLYPEGTTPPVWDALNVPVWYTEYEGCLIVKTFSPRVNLITIQVIEGLTVDEISYTDVSNQDVALPRMDGWRPINMADVDID